MRFVMAHRYVKDKTDTEIVYINAEAINFFSPCSDGKGTRISMNGCFFLVEEPPDKILYRIQREALNHAN